MSWVVQMPISVSSSSAWDGSTTTMQPSPFPTVANSRGEEPTPALGSLARKTPGGSFNSEDHQQLDHGLAVVGRRRSQAWNSGR